MTTDNLIIFTDGGSRGNPGPSACAFVIPNVHQQGKYLGIGTNNNAEYYAVLEAFKYLQTITPPTSLSFFLDSELVVKQLQGVYKIKDNNLLSLANQIKKYSEKYQVTYTHIPRSQNSAADALVNIVLDENIK